MHRDTPSCATQQPGLPPPLLSVHAQQARLLPKHKSEKGHARHADMCAALSSLQTLSRARFHPSVCRSQLT